MIKIQKCDKCVFCKPVDMNWANLFLGNVRKCIICGAYEYDGEGIWQSITREEGLKYVRDANAIKAIRFGFAHHGA